MNADKYIEVIRRKVVKDMERAFLNEGKIFRQDLALCHTAKKVKKFLKKSHQGPSLVREFALPKPD